MLANVIRLPDSHKQQNSSEENCLNSFGKLHDCDPLCCFPCRYRRVKGDEARAVPGAAALSAGKAVGFGEEWGAQPGAARLPAVHSLWNSPPPNPPHTQHAEAPACRHPAQPGLIVRRHTLHTCIYSTVDGSRES